MTLRRSIVIMEQSQLMMHFVWMNTHSRLARIEVRSMMIHVVKDTKLPMDDGEELARLRIVGVIEIKSDESMCSGPHHLSMGGQDDEGDTAIGRFLVWLKR